MRRAADEPILTVPAPGASLDWEALAARFPALRALVGCPQDPVHHAEGDVAVHTRLVCEALASRDGWRALPEHERALTLAAALFHDIAKPDTTRCEDDGRVTAHGHSRRGEQMVRRTLWEHDVDPHLREAVAAMVRFHQAPFFLVGQDDADRRAFAMSWRLRCDHLALLAEADMRGRVSPDQGRVLDAIELFRLHCAERECLAAPRAFANATSRFEYFHRDGRSPDYAAWEPADAFEVVLLCGLPGAGKDTWARTHRPGLPTVSLDDLRDATSDDDPGAVVFAAKERARVLLRAREPFVWNATNLTRARRAELIALFTDYGARVRVVYVEASRAVLRTQNRNRARRVPEAVIARMLDRWEPPDPTEAHDVEWVFS